MCFYLYPYETRSSVRGQVSNHMMVYFTTIKLETFLHSDSCHTRPALVPYIRKNRDKSVSL